MFNALYQLWGRMGFLPFLDKLEPMPKDLLQDAVNKETLRLTKIISASLIIFYTLFVIAYYFSPPSGERTILIFSHVSSIILLGIFLKLSYSKFAIRHAMLVSVLASLIPLTNILHRFYVLQDPVVTISLIAGLLILASVALDTGWLICVILYILVGWLFVVNRLNLTFDFTLIYYVMSIIICSIASFAICQMRCRTVRNFSSLRWHESQQRQELEEAQEILKAQNAELIHVDELKTAFLGNMSHELRTPLTAITGFTEVLQNESFGPLNDKQKNYLNNIAVSGSQLLDLVNNVLTLSSFDAKQVPMHPESNSIRSVIDTAINVLKQDIDKKQIAIKITLEAEDTAYFDVTLINQVMLNFLANALKFSENKSSVQIKTSDKSDAISIEVIDTGIGVAEENHPLLFLPFSQVDASINRSHEGAGLGLALCKRIVEQHGGEVFVYSTLGEGSSFGFTLPKVQPMKAHQTPVSDLSNKSGSSDHLRVQ